MIIEIKAPLPGESVTEVEIGEWMVEDGATVEMDDELVEINSDKATLMVAAEDDGVIQIIKGAGEVVAVGEIIGKLDTSGAGSKPKTEAPKEDSQPKEEPKAQPQPETAETYAKGVPSVSAAKLMAENHQAAA